MPKCLLLVLYMAILRRVQHMMCLHGSRLASVQRFALLRHFAWCDSGDDCLQLLQPFVGAFHPQLSPGFARRLRRPVHLSLAVRVLKWT